MSYHFDRDDDDGDMSVESKSPFNGGGGNNNNKSATDSSWEQGSMPPEGPPPSMADLGKRGVRPYSPNALKMRRKMRKNNREKQRRTELNDKFEHLWSMLNLGNTNKTEKFTILTEAINVIGTLQTENAELRRERYMLRARLDGMTSSLQDVFPPQPDGFEPPVTASPSAPHPPPASSLASLHHHHHHHHAPQYHHESPASMFEFGTRPSHPTTATATAAAAAHGGGIDDSPFRTGNNPFNSHPNPGISPNKFGLLSTTFVKRSPFGFPMSAKSPGNPFANIRSPMQVNQALVQHLNAMSPPVDDVVMESHFDMLDDTPLPHFS